MDQDFFTYLPSDITIGILSRLPVRTIMRCRCVCKSWLDLISTPQFDKLHRSKSVCGRAILDWDTPLKPNKLIEFVDEVDLNCQDHRWNLVCNFDLPFHRSVHSLVHSSANGLLFLYQEGLFACELFICNPVTREYIIIPPPSSKLVHRIETYGFGVSRLTDQYKLVRIFHDDVQRRPRFEYVPFECQVYTVGSGSWRRVASGSPLKYAEKSVGAFLNGNLHWMASNDSSVQISCLDLDTELFSTFSPPPPGDDPDRAANLSVLENCLCLCSKAYERTCYYYEIDIWLMKEYGDEKSWTKDYVISCKVDVYPFAKLIFPIKVFKNGDILMTSRSFKLLYYSSKTNTVEEVDAYPGFDRGIFSCRTIFSPSFLPLNSFKMEHVNSF